MAWKASSAAVMLAEQAAAHAHHHGAVPLHQEGEGRLVPLRAKPLQEFGVGQVPGLVGLGRVAQVSENALQGFSRHGCFGIRRDVPPPSSALRDTGWTETAEIICGGL